MQMVHRTAAASGVAESTAATAIAGPGTSAVQLFLDAFNRRSVDAMLTCLSADAVYHNLNYLEAFEGKQAVESVLQKLVAGAPDSWRLVVDDTTGDASATAVVFHLADSSGGTVPLSHGIAFYRLDQAGQICRIWEASEQVFKVPQVVLPALGAAAPLLQALSSGPLAGLLPGRPAAMAAPAAPWFAAAALQPGPSSSVGSSASVGATPSAWQAGRQSGGSSGGAAPLPSTPFTPKRSPVAAAAAATSSSAGGSSNDGIDGLAGVWIKDPAASDAPSFARACDLMQLSGLQKTTATTLIEGLEIEQQGAKVAVRFLTVVPFFKVTEAYVLDSQVSMSRRDLRRGNQQASAKVAPGGGSSGGGGDVGGGSGGASGSVLQVAINWSEPNAGSIDEQYRLLDAGTLECVSTVQVAAGRESTRTVYRRSEGWRPQFRWNPLLGAV